MRSSIPISGVQLAARAAAAAGLSIAVADLLHLEFPIYAMLAAVIVTDLSAAQTRKLALRRLLATVVGATSGALLSPLLPHGPLSVAIGILVAMLICYFIGASEGAKVAGYICGIVVLAHGTDTWEYAFYRLIETMLGVCVAWLISTVPKLLRSEEADSISPSR